jgi:hypothetical protein
MIGYVQAVEARAIGGFGQLNPLGSIDEAALEGDVNHW